jgi:hypothetical protein
MQLARNSARIGCIAGRSPTPDESTLYTQSDRVAQPAPTSKKPNTPILLQIHKEMDPDQIARLESTTNKTSKQEFNIYNFPVDSAEFKISTKRSWAIVDAL